LRSRRSIFPTPTLTVPEVSSSNYGQVGYLSLDPKTGRVTVKQEADLRDFEKILLNKLEQNIMVPLDMKNQKSEKGRVKHEKEERRRLLEEDKKKKYFYALRKRVTDFESMVVNFA
jgi:hypothetical protein